MSTPIETDALVVGAGPVGLFQVFQLGLLEMRAQVIDSLPYAGGQCVELYGDKPIYDIPSVKVCTGRELTENLLKQAEPFGAAYHLGDVVASLQRLGDGRFDVQTTHGKRFTAKVIVIAAGVGAFLPRKLKVEGMAAFEGRQLFYTPPAPESVAARDVMVLGGDDAALDAVIALAEAGHARNLTLVHRRDVFQAEPARIDDVQALIASGRVNFILGQLTGVDARGEQLVAVKVTDPHAQTQSVALDMLVAPTGLSPKLGPIADWGLAMERKQLVVDTEQFSTSERGIFAVGDINTYPGKKKLILSGFHEATLAAFGAAAIVFPDRKTPLQYTTTSPRLHQLLGVATPGRD